MVPSSRVQRSPPRPLMRAQTDQARAYQPSPLGMDSSPSEAGNMGKVRHSPLRTPPPQPNFDNPNSTNFYVATPEQPPAIQRVQSYDPRPPSNQQQQQVFQQPRP